MARVLARANDGLIQALGESHNIVSVYQFQGKDIQSSFDCAGELLKSRYRDWYLTLTELPTWGEKIDSQVQVYINSVQNIALANLNWRLVVLSTLYLIHSFFCNHEADNIFFCLSYRAERYWNGNNNEVRKSRIITLPVQHTATATVTAM